MKSFPLDVTRKRVACDTISVFPKNFPHRRSSMSSAISLTWDMSFAGGWVESAAVAASRRVAANRVRECLTNRYRVCEYFCRGKFSSGGHAAEQRVKDVPRNVAATWLSFYASLRDRSSENAGMQDRWRALLRELERTTEFEILHRLGFLDLFPGGSGMASKFAMPGRTFSTRNPFRPCYARMIVIPIPEFRYFWRRREACRILPATMARWMAATSSSGVTGM